MKQFSILQKLISTRWIILGGGLMTAVAFTAPQLKYHNPNGVTHASGIGSTNRTGAPGESTCSSCHHTGPDNSATGSIVVNIPTITRGVAVAGSVTITASSTTTGNCGFQLLATDGTNSSANTMFGTFTAVSSTCSVNATTGRLNHKSSSLSGGTYTWNFTYTAPANATVVKFYVAGHASSSGSKTYTSTKTVAIPVPVRFSNFTAAEKNKSVLINWTSEDEINIGHYEVEAGTDGINFTKIANVNTLSVPGNAKNYSFTDNTNYLNASVVYYRIKSIDMDGLHSDYTNIVSVKRVGKIKGALNINPNITSGNINIRFLQTEASKVQLSVVDLSGKTVINKEQATSKGMNNINMDLGQLANGLYYVKILDGENSYIQSVLKN